MKRHPLVPAILLAALLAGPAAAAVPAPASPQPENNAPAGEEDMSGMADPYLVACLAALSLGEVTRGVQFCTLALSLEPEDPDALQLRGYGFLLQHRFDRAEEDFRAGLKIRPDDAEDLAGLGQSLVGLARYPEAVTYFSRAVQLAPEDAAFRNGLCWARGAAGKDLDAALDDCNAALRLAPGAATPFNSKGLVELRMGRYAAAIEDYTASLAARPAQPSAHFGRGLAHLYMGKKAAGTADILAARAGDRDIDSMFVAMGLLPDDCAAKAKVKCPAGFPAKAPQGDWMIARWLSLR